MVYLLLFICSLLSGLVLFFAKRDFKKLIPSILSFSGAYLIGISFLHLLPELFVVQDHTIGLFLACGFFLQLILDYFSGGIEHGHTHLNKNKIGTFPVLVFFSLSIHAFLEALPLIEMVSNRSFNSYLVGLLIHKAPISFVMTSLLFAYQLPRKIIFIALIAFSLWAPLGAFLGDYIALSQLYFQRLFALSLGIILHLSTTILIENNDQHQIHWKKLLPLILGIFLALMSFLIH